MVEERRKGGPNCPCGECVILAAAGWHYDVGAEIGAGTCIYVCVYRLLNYGEEPPVIV